MPHNLPSIPNVPPDHSEKVYLDPMRESIEVMSGSRNSGDKKNAVPTWQDLVDAGVITADKIPK